MYNLHVTGKTPFHFLDAVSSPTKYTPPSNLAPSSCVVLPPTGHTGLRAAVGGSEHNTVPV